MVLIAECHCICKRWGLSEEIASIILWFLDWLGLFTVCPFLWYCIMMPVNLPYEYVTVKIVSVFFFRCKYCIMSELWRRFAVYPKLVNLLYVRQIVEMCCTDASWVKFETCLKHEFKFENKHKLQFVLKPRCAKNCEIGILSSKCRNKPVKTGSLTWMHAYIKWRNWSFN